MELGWTGFVEFSRTECFWRSTKEFSRALCPSLSLYVVPCLNVKVDYGKSLSTGAQEQGRYIQKDFYGATTQRFYMATVHCTSAFSVSVSLRQTFLLQAAFLVIAWELRGWSMSFHRYPIHSNLETHLTTHVIPHVRRKCIFAFCGRAVLLRPDTSASDYRFTKNILACTWAITTNM